MRILIRLPNWLGDGVMLTPTFETLKEYYKDSRFVLVGPKSVCDLYSRDLRVERIFIDHTKKAKNRFMATYRLAKEIGKCDLAITFTNHFYSALLLYFTGSVRRVGFSGFLRNFLLTDRVRKIRAEHQVLSYQLLIKALGIDLEIGKLRLTYQDIELSNDKKNIGIAAGAAFGSAKAWPVEYFAEVVVYLVEQGYRVFLFGSAQEKEINHKIFKLAQQKVSLINQADLLDLSDKTSILQLVDYIAKLDLFIGNDSGPTHISSTFDIPSIVLYGPNHPSFCLPWKTKNSMVINKHLSCSPCQKRECPLGHHECMRQIKPQEVIEAIERQLGETRCK